MIKRLQHITTDKYAKIFFSYFLLLWLYRINSHTLLISTFNQPLKDPGTDYTFWLAHILQFPDFIITHYWLCVLLDVGVVVLVVCCLIFKRTRYIFASLLFLIFFLQRITLETYSASHTKSISCLFMALLPFCFKKEENASLLIEFGRYFLIYVLVISAYHKYHYGALFNPDNFSNVLVNQHLDLATLNPAHISYRIASFLIKHKTLADCSFYALFLTQLIFAVGIFTKKYDRLLFILLIAFAISTYLVMRIYNFDITVLGLTLIYFSNSKKTEA